MIISTSESSELEGGMSLSRVFVFPGDDRKEVLAKNWFGESTPNSESRISESVSDDI